MANNRTHLDWLLEFCQNAAAYQRVCLTELQYSDVIGITEQFGLLNRFGSYGSRSGYTVYIMSLKVAIYQGVTTPILSSLKIESNTSLEDCAYQAFLFINSLLIAYPPNKIYTT